MKKKARKKPNSPSSGGRNSYSSSSPWPKLTKSRRPSGLSYFGLREIKLLRKQRNKDTTQRKSGSTMKPKNSASSKSMPKRRMTPEKRLKKNGTKNTSRHPRTG